MPNTSSKAHQIPNTSSKAHQIPNSSSKVQQIPNTSSKAHQIPNTSSKAHQIPNTSSKAHQIPNTSSKVQQITNTSSNVQQIPNISSKVQQIPNSSSNVQQISNTSSNVQQIPNTIINYQPSANTRTSIKIKIQPSSKTSKLAELLDMADKYKKTKAMNCGCKQDYQCNLKYQLVTVHECLVCRQMFQSESELKSHVICQHEWKNYTQVMPQRQLKFKVISHAPITTSSVPRPTPTPATNTSTLTVKQFKPTRKRPRWKSIKPRTEGPVVVLEKLSESQLKRYLDTPSTESPTKRHKIDCENECLTNGSETIQRNDLIGNSDQQSATSGDGTQVQHSNEAASNYKLKKCTVVMEKLERTLDKSVWEDLWTKWAADVPRLRDRVKIQDGKVVPRPLQFTCPLCDCCFDISSYATHVTTAHSQDRTITVQNVSPSDNDWLKLLQSDQSENL